MYTFPNSLSPDMGEGPGISSFVSSLHSRHLMEPNRAKRSWGTGKIRGREVGWFIGRASALLAEVSRLIPDHLWLKGTR